MGVDSKTDESPFDFFENYEGLDDIAKRVVKKYGLKRKQDIWVDKDNRGKRPSVQVADARGEFLYEAYKTGRYSLKHLAKWMQMRDRFGLHTSKNQQQIVDRMITRWCNKYNKPRPKWGPYTRPYWRAFDGEPEYDHSTCEDDAGSEPRNSGEA